MCQGDLSLGACQGCLNASVTLITDRCPTGMNSTVWYNHCMLRYSNENFFSTVDIIPYVVYVKNLAMHNASDPRILIFHLAKAARSSPKMFAMDNVSLPNSTNIYGLEQCTRDLSADDCYNCLLDAVGSIPTVSNGSQGCRVLGQSCSIRYEMYPFYNISAIEVVSPPLSLSPASSPTGNELKGNDYMAPEYALHGLFSAKSDVYSYGVLILEILTGQKNSGYRGFGYPVELVTHVVWCHWTQGSALQMIDQGLVEQCQAPQILSHFVGLPTPSAPAFLSNRNTTSESNGILKRGNSSASKGNLMKISENNVSISTLKPR
ncbi:hypothetical protein ZIOFF_029155 [Zingiber officinale]|uniref:Gnk2-homologous domain-containing protein n=1 Tax=Zingiber officinale TaxID=94328 RepID=A0A8J5GR35_ZINOF|nr:hypothetical protein ZIOFF_029155 [Zingiber officinale]